MQKKIIALAIASALISPVAMAADVAVTGGLQAEVVSMGGLGATPNGLYVTDGWEDRATTAEGAGSYGYLKFSATEDLGDGMKALAVFNFQTNVGDAGTAAIAGRESYVGLSGGMGTMLVGTMSSPYKSSTASYDPFLATSFQARSNNGMSTLFNGYVSNAVAYANNFMDGQIKLVAALVVDEAQAAGEDKTTAHHGKSFSVNYDPSAQLNVSFAHIDTTDMGGATDSAPNMKANKIGAKYTMDAITVAAQVEMLGEGYSTDANKQSGNVMFVSASYAMDKANTVSASYGSTSEKLTARDTNDTYFAFGLNHAFSKKTSGMVSYRASKLGETAAVGSTTDRAIGAVLRVNF